MPSLYIIAGPNGAGKTTFIKRFARRHLALLDFINADEIARGLSPLAPERAQIASSKVDTMFLKSISAAASGSGCKTSLASIARFQILGTSTSMRTTQRSLLTARPKCWRSTTKRSLKPWSASLT